MRRRARRRPARAGRDGDRVGARRALPGPDPVRDHDHRFARRRPALGPDQRPPREVPGPGRGPAPRRAHGVLPGRHAVLGADRRARAREPAQREPLRLGRRRGPGPGRAPPRDPGAELRRPQRAHQQRGLQPVHPGRRRDDGRGHAGDARAGLLRAEARGRRHRARRDGCGRRRGGPVSDGAATTGILAARGLRKVYRGRAVVDDVDFEVRPGEVTGLLGPNGAGKTTTFYIVVGFIRPDGGTVTLDGADLARLPMYKRARLGIGYLPQESSIFRRLTVEQNLMAILETLPLGRAARRERVEELLEEMRITHIRKSSGYQLSGGERRRVEIARALTTRPRFMLLDEPFAGIDPIAVADLQRSVARLREQGLGILITDHNVRETLSITDRAYIMFEGRIALAGTSGEIVADSRAREIYLGEGFRL
ncbi:LPS export ABC transporter ATP-binding protein [bacterium]|nr:LPS export ABC transporter ATP-binding protein [bacterium]